ncbi:MAG: MotA/TolQ/ExbB proton channel family protein [Rickettsiales bacterium]|nr:MotA/TolQ/ExbB proton channel family protein [Rickettsiales bacterium]
MNTQNITLQIFATLLHSDFITKAILFILIGMSIFSWTLIFEKFFKFKLMSIKTSKFEKLFWSGDMLEDIYQKVKNNTKCPSIVVFISAMQEWTNSNVQNIIKTNDVGRKNSLKDRLYDVMSVAINRSLKKIKGGLSFLLIVSTTSTLLGLFGTAWGLSSAFKAISIMKDATLTTIAPGISSSLVTTIVGMLTAIPATAAYYFIKSQINNYEEELENFKLEVLSILSKEMD